MSDPTKEADFEAHVSTYRGFVSMMKWNIIALVVVVLALYFIVNP